MTDIFLATLTKVKKTKFEKWSYEKNIFSTLDMIYSKLLLGFMITVMRVEDAYLIYSKTLGRGHSGQRYGYNQEQNYLEHLATCFFRDISIPFQIIENINTYKSHI